jgi:FtsH-binding integral membrane protein
MAVIGTTTKLDLTKFGSIFMMALVGLIIATIVNIFWANSTLYWVITYVGVILFVGLTAYDAQKIKQMLQMYGTEENETTQKIALMGSLSLYLDFINLFIYLLRILGARRD